MEGIGDGRVDRVGRTDERTESDRLRGHVIPPCRDDVTPLVGGLAVILARILTPLFSQVDPLEKVILTVHRADRAILRWGGHRHDVARRRDARLAGADLDLRRVGDPGGLGIIMEVRRRQHIRPLGRIASARIIEPAIGQSVDARALSVAGDPSGPESLFQAGVEPIRRRGFVSPGSILRRQLGRGCYPLIQTRRRVMPTETLLLRVVRHRPSPPLVIGVPHSNPAFRTGYPPPTDLDWAG